MSRPALGAASLLFVALVALSPLPLSGTGSVSVALAHGAQAAATPAALVPTVSGAANLVPSGGRLFNTTLTPPDGSANSVTGVAVDSSTGIAFAANQAAGTVTAFNETTGALVSSVTLTNLASGIYPSGLALDAANHRLFVSISTGFSRLLSGWLLVLNESTFAVEGNYSFQGAPISPFEPTYLAYDPPTNQVFVENMSWGYVGIVNLTSGHVGPFLTCPVVTCAYHGYGLIDVPQYHTLVVPTCALRIWFVNTSNDSTRAVVAGPNGSLMAWAAFDTVDNWLWVENYTFSGTQGSFFRMNMSTLAITANVPGAPPRGTGLLYDPALDLLVGTNLNVSDGIASFSASTGTLVAAYSGGTANVHPFFTSALDSRTGIAIGAGQGNGTAVSFLLPDLTPERVYPSFSATQPLAAVDPHLGIAYVVGTSPDTLRAIDESSGAPAWTSSLPPGSLPSAIAVDPTDGLVLVADQSTDSIGVWNASLGNALAPFALTGGIVPSALLWDASTDWLYLGSTTGTVQAFDLATGLPVGGVSLPTPVSALAQDPVTGEILALSPGAASTVTQIGATSLAAGSPWSVGSYATGLATNNTGAVFVLEDSGSVLATYNSTTGTAIGTTLSLGGQRATALVSDAPDGVLFAAVSPATQLVSIDPSHGTFVGNLTLDDPAGALAFDAGHSVLVAPDAYTGEVWIDTMVPVPGAPPGLAVVAGNNTASVSWGAPSAAGGYAVTGYQVTVRAPGSGPGGPIVGLTVNSTHVTGLRDGVPYVVRVVALSAAGRGTLAATATVLPLGAPYPPTSVNVVPDGHDGLTVTWGAPASDDGSNVTLYDVHYAPRGGTTWADEPTGTAPNLDLTGLSAGTNYSVYVTATNQAGTSNASAIVSASTPAAPGASTGPGTLLYLELGGAIVLAVVIGVGAVAFWRRRRAPPAAAKPPSP